MADSKNQTKETTDSVAALTALMNKARREGTIQATELVSELEKLDLSVEKNRMEPKLFRRCLKN